MNFTEIKNKINPILESNDIEFAGIFGSYARGGATNDSDIDILVRLRNPKGLLAIVGLEMALSDALQKKVDLVTETGLCSHVKKDVLKDLRPIYGRR